MKVFRINVRYCPLYNINKSTQLEIKILESYIQFYKYFIITRHSVYKYTATVKHPE